MASKILNASVKTSFSQINKLKFFKINIESKLLTWHSRLRFQVPIQALPRLHPYTPLHLLSLEHCICSLWNTEPHPNWIHLLCTFLCSQGSLCLDRVSLSLSLSLSLSALAMTSYPSSRHSSNTFREAIPGSGPLTLPLVTCNPPNVSAAHSAVLPYKVWHILPYVISSCGQLSLKGKATFPCILPPPWRLVYVDMKWTQQMK